MFIFNLQKFIMQVLISTIKHSFILNVILTQVKGLVLLQGLIKHCTFGGFCWWHDIFTTFANIDLLFKNIFGMDVNVL